MDFNSDINKFVKENFNNFLDGKFTGGGIFTEDQIEMAKQVGFILNHLTIRDSSFPEIKYVVSYDGTSISFNFKQDLDYMIDPESYIMSVIRDTDDFKLLYLTFIRDYKLNKIIS